MAAPAASTTASIALFVARKSLEEASVRRANADWFARYGHEDRAAEEAHLASDAAFRAQTTVQSADRSVDSHLADKAQFFAEQTVREAEAALRAIQI